MNGIVFKRTNGGLGRRLPGSDYISGLIIFGDYKEVQTFPAFRTIREAEAEGIEFKSDPMAHYHLQEFVRTSEGGSVYLMLVPNSMGFSVIRDLQSYAKGDLRQVGIYCNKALSDVTKEIDQIQKIANDLALNNMPLSVILSPSITQMDLDKLPDLHTLEADRVSICISQDGAGLGAYMKNNSGTIGALLGTIAKSRVSDNVGWIERYNQVTSAYPKELTGGEILSKELDVPAFGNGVLMSSLSPAQEQQLNDKGYIFLRKHVGITGSYWNDAFTCTTIDSDYAYLENNRTVDKSLRGIYQALLPKVSGPAYVDPQTGFLTVDTVTALEALAEQPLAQMERDGELSGYRVEIDNEQDVLSSSKLQVTVKLVPVGVLREIIVSLGFTIKTN